MVLALKKKCFLCRERMLVAAGSEGKKACARTEVLQRWSSVGESTTWNAVGG